MATLEDYRDVIRLYGGEWFTFEDLAEASQHLSGLEPPHFDYQRVKNAIITFRPPLERKHPNGSKFQEYRERK